MSTQFVDLHVKITKEQHETLRMIAYYRGQRLAEVVREILTKVNKPKRKI